MSLKTCLAEHAIPRILDTVDNIYCVTLPGHFESHLDPIYDDRA
jgi:hypothetical protein